MHYFEYGQEEIEHLRRRDVRLGRVIDRLGVLKAEMYPDLFTALVSSVVGQQISGKAAATVWNRVVQRFGEISPIKLDQASVEEIQSCGMSFRKAEYVKGIARACTDGDLDLDEFKELPDGEVVKALCSLKGIGPWTAEMMLIFSLGRKDVVSWGDLAIRRGMMSLYGLGYMGKPDFERFRARYSPYGSVASLYIWELAHQPSLLDTNSRRTVR
ncbi:MAG: DNA-3-methyladenine glycosylase 2 family protein [Euryarchaeota archaeon]|nr:DNA-3-methyladenine glycosylase 2 family protein [Euryarchaeota archaeon]